MFCGIFWGNLFSLAWAPTAGYVRHYINKINSECQTNETITSLDILDITAQKKSLTKLGWKCKVGVFLGQKHRAAGPLGVIFFLVCKNSAVSQTVPLFILWYTRKVCKQRGLYGPQSAEHNSGETGSMLLSLLCRATFRSKSSETLSSRLNWLMLKKRIGGRQNEAAEEEEAKCCGSNFPVFWNLVPLVV